MLVSLLLSAQALFSMRRQFWDKLYKVIVSVDLLLTTLVGSEGTYKESRFKFKHIFTTKSSQVFKHVTYLTWLIKRKKRTNC
jgi:hypothetical protein